MIATDYDFVPMSETGKPVDLLLYCHNRSAIGEIASMYEQITIWDWVYDAVMSV